jgi:hypothetical protein
MWWPACRRGAVGHPGQRQRGQLHRRRAQHGRPQAQIASLTASALTTGSAMTPALIASFAIEVLQSIAGPPNRRRDTIVVC